jgi:hypothetical protein
MANPMPDEVQVYERIQSGEYSVDPKVIEFLRHHIGNDLQVICLCARGVIDAPGWMVKATCIVNRTLYMIHFRSVPARDLLGICREILTRAENINGVLEKVKRTIRQNGKKISYEAN